MATAGMFLACKIEENPRLLCDVVVVDYDMKNKWDYSATKNPDNSELTQPCCFKISYNADCLSNNFLLQEICDKQKELITSRERQLLATVAFDLNIQLHYRLLVSALKKLNIFPDLAKVAWNL